jgi:hypothetical protein
VPKISKPYPWEELYKAAVLETDSSLLPARIATARREINLRFEELQKDHQNAEEYEAIACALAWIKILEHERV